MAAEPAPPEPADVHCLLALGLDQIDEQAAQVWAVHGEGGLDTLAAGLKDARLPVSAAGRVVAVLRATGCL